MAHKIFNLLLAFCLADFKLFNIIKFGNWILYKNIQMDSKQNVFLSRQWRASLAIIQITNSSCWMIQHSIRDAFFLLLM